MKIDEKKLTKNQLSIIERIKEGAFKDCIMFLEISKDETGTSSYLHFPESIKNNDYLEKIMNIISNVPSIDWVFELDKINEYGKSKEKFLYAINYIKNHGKDYSECPYVMNFIKKYNLKHEFVDGEIMIQADRKTLKLWNYEIK